MQLTQKETDLLKDLKNEEQLCIDKYTRHSSCAKDAQLKNLFSSIATQEKEHLKTLEQIASGNPPAPAAASQKAEPTFTATYTTDSTPDKESDCYLCTDVLTGEKHASALYDTCIFEFDDENCRKLLNHIQTEEQEHGKQVYDYMKANSKINLAK